MAVIGRQLLDRLRAPTRRSRLYRRERWFSILFLAPAVLFLLFTSVYPLAYSLMLSFSSYNMSIPNAQPLFVGWQNFQNVLGSPDFQSSFRVSLTYVGFAVAIEFVLGMGLALVVTSGLRLIGVLRTALLVPIMMTPVVAGVLWRTLFNPTYGVINYLLGLVHLGPYTWLGSASQALPAVITVEIWQQLPVVTFILAAGIQALPIDVFESARLDGASAWQIFLHITLPLLEPVILVVLLLRIMDAFKTFDIVYTMTQGGPGGSTDVLSMQIYRTGLQFLDMGTASAMSWLFLVMILIISIFFVHRLQRMEAR